MKILVLTIGGSCAPIVTSIKQNKPDFVVFICSDDDRFTDNKGSYISVEGTGNVCGNNPKNPDKPNIVQQVRLTKEKYSIYKIEHYDDHNECYKFCLNLLKELHTKYEKPEIIADYTGGTKSMTVGLVTAASDLGDITIAIVKGERSNLVKVDDGTERVRLSRINYAALYRQIEIANSFISKFAFTAAQNLLDNMFSSITDVPKDLDDRLQLYYSTAKIFNAWDKFDHIYAFQLLYPIRDKYPEHMLFLRAVVCSRLFIDKQFRTDSLSNFKPMKIINGYEVVEDLLLNAERRAKQQRFDDATARLYRALELFVQIYLLKTYNIETSNVEIESLPEKAKLCFSENKKKRVKIGLLESYDLLDKLEDKTIATWFVEKKNHILRALELRNYSILAHGFTPLSAQDYQTAHTIIVTEFLQPLLNKFSENRKNITPVQFPETIIS